MPGREQLVVPRELDEGVAPVEQDRFEHAATLAVVARRILWALLALTPLVLASRYVIHLNETALFILAALALIPLAWLIGEATEQAAEHTGPGIGGFLNASFGNAPELIIALLAVADGLPDVVRGSLTGSVVSNILLVLGAAMIAGGDGRIDARSLRWQLAAVFGGVLLLTLTSIPAWHSDSPDSHASVPAFDSGLRRAARGLPRRHDPQPADPQRRRRAKRLPSTHGRCGTRSFCSRWRRSRRPSSPRSSSTRSTTSAKRSD